MVSRRDHLSAACEIVLRRQQRRHRRFRGLTQKLDYLKDLGATAIWVMPFYPSPLRDDGYDISSLSRNQPGLWKLRDFKRFVREAHERGLRVITELVINHTSDQHPWFQRAREAKPGSAERDFYVWANTDQEYADAPHHFSRYGKIELGLGSVGQCLLLASLLLRTNLT